MKHISSLKNETIHIFYFINGFFSMNACIKLIYWLINHVEGILLLSLWNVVMGI